MIDTGGSGIAIEGEHFWKDPLYHVMKQCRWSPMNQPEKWTQTITKLRTSTSPKDCLTIWTTCWCSFSQQKDKSSLWTRVQMKEEKKTEVASSTFHDKKQPLWGLWLTVRRFCSLCHLSSLQCRTVKNIQHRVWKDGEVTEIIFIIQNNELSFLVQKTHLRLTTGHPPRSYLLIHVQINADAHLHDQFQIPIHEAVKLK